ncbi:uncharacterized protein LOC129925998 [Biomphalaria glabrata]|uniref:Uncharacterized protein LOC129925998 n=1 Tax=Biomphalaria glabrata TaxID=6526 RepID=A0A9W3A8B9_BIOGL|nr:uncharacterized protein LOC129925998 [Biomphalaria glabrata]
MMLQFTVLILLLTGYVHCYCTDYIFSLSCGNSFVSDLKGGATLCSALSTYIDCFLSDCDLDATMKDSIYNGVLKIYAQNGYTCNTKWNDLDSQYQGTSLLGSFSGTAVKNRAISERSQTFLATAFVSLGALTFILQQFYF